MANMSYCRFENTARDLQDCYDNLHDKLTSEYEISARKRLIEICALILDECEGVTVEWDAEEATVQEYEDEED